VRIGWSALMPVRVSCLAIALLAVLATAAAAQAPDSLVQPIRERPTAMTPT
jgi:hypothetical protein